MCSCHGILERLAGFECNSTVWFAHFCVTNREKERDVIVCTTFTREIRKFRKCLLTLSQCEKSKESFMRLKTLKKIYT
jgi:hypothetical protein